MTPKNTPNDVFHKIQRAHNFHVEALINAYHFPSKPLFEPFFEEYDFSQIIYVTKGEGIYTTETDRYPFSSGMMFYRPAHRRSKYEWTTNEASFAVISFVCSSSTMQAFPCPPFSLFEEESVTLLDLMKTGARIFEYVKGESGERGMKPRDDVPNAVLDFVFASLERFLSMVYCRLSGITLLVDESKKVNCHIEDSELIENVKQYLAHHLSTSLTLADVCEHFGFSQTALCKKFKQATGKSLIDYFTDQKISHAKNLIRTDTKSFTEIAELLGFSSVNYFSKVFKAHVGVTPTEFSRFVSKRNRREK